MRLEIRGWRGWELTEYTPSALFCDILLCLERCDMLMDIMSNSPFWEAVRGDGVIGVIGAVILKFELSNVFIKLLKCS